MKRLLLALAVAALAAEAIYVAHRVLSDPDDQEEFRW